MILPEHGSEETGCIGIIVNLSIWLAFLAIAFIFYVVLESVITGFVIIAIAFYLKNSNNDKSKQK